MTQNSYNVPQQVWTELGTKGQEQFNRLYESLKSKKQEFTQNAPQQLTENREQLNQFTETIIQKVAIEATRQLTQQQTQGQGSR
jgi:glutamyl-tRNA reductase